MTDIATSFDFGIGTPCPPNNPYCGNRDRHLHGSFACELRCPCRSGFSEEARIQAQKDWSYQRSPEDYLRKILTETFGLNPNSPDYNDQLWINGLTPPTTVTENLLREVFAEHFGVVLHGPDYTKEIGIDGELPPCKPAAAEEVKRSYIELNHDQVTALAAAFYAEKTRRSHEDRGWDEQAAKAVIVRENNINKAKDLGVPEAQINRYVYPDNV